MFDTEKLREVYKAYGSITEVAEAITQQENEVNAV